MTRRFRYAVVLALMTAGMLGGQYALAMASAADSPSDFAPLDQWKAALLAGDAVALKTFYSTDPVAQVMANGVRTNADADVSFWLGLKARSITLETVAVLDRPKGKSVVFKAEVQL